LAKTSVLEKQFHIYLHMHFIIAQAGLAVKDFKRTI